MDAKQYMIVDLQHKGNKRMFVTDNVSSIYKNKNEGWTVKYSSSPRVFNYNPSRLLYLKDPETINLGEKGLYINNIHINNVAELLRFTDGHYTFFRVTYNNGFCENLEGKNVYITRTPIYKNGGSTWDYLCKLADETGLRSEKDDESLLSRQYKLVDLMRDNVPLAQYLGNKKELATYPMPQQVYYPFGCNASQKTAVETALTHQVSIIQGPPGTGKTQTILNIIANLLMENKSVLVVSYNNSAVENVAEKLSIEGLGFLVAQLGSKQNKEKFIANQQEYPVMTDWMLDKETNIWSRAIDSLQAVSQGFDAQLRQAKLKAEYDALLKESTYNQRQEENHIVDEWLNGKPSAKIIKLLNRYKRIIEQGDKPGLWLRLQWAFLFGTKIFTFLNRKATDAIKSLESAYYISRKSEIERELESIASALQIIGTRKSMEELRSSSLQLLKDRIARRYNSKQRTKFEYKDIKSRTIDFLKEYPVVLSTTSSAKNCINKNMVFDYLIMDEASQVDIKTGALALSCATNAVIVGDDKQLPNVVSREEELALNAIQSAYKVENQYNAATHSFLQSCLEVFLDSPVTLLREHYRCHPKIIEFCNQLFYNGELIAMTTDKGEKDVLQVIRTVPGNHAKGHFNQREIDVITQEVLPECSESESLGIITPYRVQAQSINQVIRKEIASTVHKYQGRECDTIIMSMVDNNPTEFSDDANLLNVAISRAKSKLCVVTNGNEMPQDSIISQLIGYIQYNNFEVKSSKLHSVFDLLYQQYTAERLAYEAAHPAISEHLSENLIYNLLIEAIAALNLSNIGVLCHYPLSRLIANWNLLEDNEKAFAENPFSHVDFLLYNSITKDPIFAIEVDGWHFHKGNVVQQSRDELKNQIFTKLGLRLLRLSTTDTVTLETIKESISSTARRPCATC